MIVRRLFATPLYEAELGDSALVEMLGDACLAIRDADRAGRRWSRDHRYRGYTSYASVPDLPQRAPEFGALVRTLDRHVVRFARDCAFDLGRRRLKLDSLWINVLTGRGTHSGHLHPHSSVSGTLYVVVPSGAGSLRFEDPRLGLMMAAPQRCAEAADDLRPFVTVAPRAGQVLLWESWLRHEVLAGSARDDRISISFNYR